MTIEEAISRFEKRNFWLKANPVCQSIQERVDKQNAEMERNELALSALRAQQEREKGCEYCNDPDTEYGAISFPRTASGKVDIDKVEAVEAYFCPNCGRALKPKEEQG